MRVALPYNDYFEYYGPDFVLDVPSSNMDNLNTREYLERTKNIILDNLRHIPGGHAPSVQMQALAPDGYRDIQDRIQAEIEERNLDERIPGAQKDRQRQRDDELSDSEDEGEGGRRDHRSYNDKKKAGAASPKGRKTTTTDLNIDMSGSAHPGKDAPKLSIQTNAATTSTAGSSSNSASDKKSTAATTPTEKKIATKLEDPMNVTQADADEELNAFLGGGDGMDLDM